MINWENLYYKLLKERVSISPIAEKHHILPRHAGGTDESFNLVSLLHKDHTLAHYIRYRWKKEFGDSCAYKMMNGNIINPMHDPNVVKYHITIMNNPDMILHLSNKAKERFTNPEERLKVSNHRKKYISTLSDPSYAARFLHTEESKQKSKAGLIKYCKNNSEIISAKMKKLHLDIKENNKSKTKEELQIQYSRGTSINNPNWKGYCYLTKDEMIFKFNTVTEFINESDLHACTVRDYIKTGKPFIQLSPLFTSHRDAGFLKSVNKELLHSLISTEVGVYKHDVTNIKVNLYDEAEKKIYLPQVRVFAIIRMDPKTTQSDDFGLSSTKTISVGFIKSDLKEKDLYLLEGDIIHYDGGYYEIDNILSANYWAGKNPNTLVGVTEDSWSLNGYDYSIIAEAHLSNISTMDIESIRTGNNPIDNNRSVPKFI